MRDNTGGRAEASAQSQTFFAMRGKQREADKAAGRGARRIDDIPPDLIFFWRVIGLIRGLCSALRVRLPYLEILGARARIALAAETPAPQRALTFAPPPLRLAERAPLHARLEALLRRPCDEGAVGGGVQACVCRGGVTLAEAAAGFRGAIDPRPLLPSTPMPLLELSSLLAVSSRTTRPYTAFDM